MKNEIQKKDESLPEEYVYRTYTRVINENDPDLEISFNDILNNALSWINVNDIVKNVKKGSEYIVQIPVEFQKQFESGEYFIMKNQTNGIEWPTLMKKNSNGRNEIVKHLQIKRESFMQGNPIQDLTQQFQMMQLQTQMQQQNLKLDEIYQTVKHVEKGQMNDRIALLHAGIEQIQLASQRDDNDLGKRAAIENGISDIVKARNQIFKELELQVQEFKPIPKSVFIRFFEDMRHIDYLGKKDEAYNKIVEYYELYKESTKYLAFSYVLIGQSQVVKTIYDNSKKELSSINYDGLRTIEYIHPNKKYIMIDDAYTKQLEYDQKTSEKIIEKIENIAIEVSGDKLLEVIENGKSRDESGS